MRLWNYAKNFRAPSEVSASFHQNMSRGYYQIDEQGNKTFVPYDRNEMGELHSLLSPGKDHYKHMKWTKTREWKDRDAVKKSRWKKTKIMGGLNIVKG